MNGGHAIKKPEEIAAINRRLAEWAGWRQMEGGIWFDFAGNGRLFLPDYRTNSAMDLLGVLEDKNYWWEMGTCQNGDKFVKIGTWYGGLVTTAQDKDLPAAICHACLEVAEREGK